MSDSRTNENEAETVDLDKTIHMLLVEDERATGEALKGLLKTFNFKVTLVSSAEQALSELNPDIHDIVVADIRLKGGMSGVALLRRIRDKMADFPVILLTGFSNLDTAIQAVRLGAQDYILKPLHTVEDLLIPSRKAVRNHRLLLRNRALESELLLIEDKERRKLAVDLHDSVGQVLAMCKLKLDTLKHEEQAASISEPLNAIHEMIERAIEQTRSLTFQLCPPSLYELGLEATLDSLTEEITERNGIVTSFEDDGEEKPIDDRIKNVLFRAVRELLMNVVKHSNARCGKVSICRDNEHVRIVVADDGEGFDVGKKISFGDDKGGFGLFSVRERLRAFGGQIEIVSNPGRGTCATIVVPFRGVEMGVKGIVP